MRIDELLFQRVGAWRDHRISLRPGLNLVVGPNEAGKSTALRAIEALLFDIPLRGREVVLSQLVAPLRVTDFEATIHVSRASDTGDEQLTWRRRGSMLEWLDGRRLQGADLAVCLWEIAHHDYRLIYALGHERLRDGARLLAAGGPLANVVADITGGTSGLPDLRERLKIQLAELYLPQGTRPALNAAFGELNRLRAARTTRLGVESHGAYLDLCKKIDDLVAAQAANRKRAEKNDQALQTLSRLRGVFSTFLELRELEAKHGLHPHASVQGDERWYARLTDAAEAVETSRDAVRRARDRLAHAASALEGRAPSSGVLEHRAVIDRVLRLQQALEDHARLLDDEMTARARALGELEGSIEACGLQDAGELTEIASALRLPPLTLEGLVKRLGALRKARDDAEAAEKTAAALKTELRGLNEEHAELPPLVALDPLEDLRRRGPLAALDEDLRRRRQQQAAAASGLRATSSRLGLPTPDDLVACLSLRTPSRSELQSRYERANALGERRTKLEAELDGTRRRLRESELRITELENTREEPVDRETLTAARRERDEALRTLTEAITTASPGSQVPSAARVDEALQQATVTIRGVDVVTDRLLDDAQRLADLDAARRERSTITKAIAHLEDAMRDARSDLDELDQRWAALWAESGIRVALEDREWVSVYETFIRETQAWQAAESLLASETRGLDALAADVRHVLAIADDTISFATLDRRLDEAFKSATALAEAHRRVTEQIHRTQGAVTLATRDAVTAREHLDEAKAALADAMIETPAFVRRDERLMEAWIERSREIATAAGAALEAVKRVDDRVAAHEAAVISIEEAWRLVLTSAPSALSAPDLTDPRSRIDALRAAYEFAQVTEGRERDLLAATRAVDDARQIERGAMSVLLACVQEVGLDVSPSGLDETVDQLRALRSLRAQIEQARRVVCDGVGLSWAEVQTTLNDRDQGALDDEIARLREASLTLRDEGEEMARSLTVLKGEREALAAGTSLAALSQQWEQAMGPMLATLEDTLATQGALFLLDEVEASIRRDDRLTAIADAASLHFARLTRGSFERVDFDAQRTSIVVTRAGGLESSLDPAALSDGTRDQLWLAFRLALIEQHMEAKRLPLVLDDVLVHFDPERAKAALEAFARFAEHTQVLMFTHDPGLVELAREASLDFNLVELPRREVGGDVPDLNTLTPNVPTPRRSLRRPIEAVEPAERVESASDGGDESEGSVDPADLEAFVVALAARSERRSGNKALRDKLEWSEARYDAVKARLVAAGRVKVGVGRGGSVTLLDPE